MGERQRIGLREVRALRPGETVWDAMVPGFGARRQTGTVSHLLLEVSQYRGPTEVALHRPSWCTLGT